MMNPAYNNRINAFGKIESVDKEVLTLSSRLVFIDRQRALRYNADHYF